MVAKNLVIAFSMDFCDKCATNWLLEPLMEPPLEPPLEPPFSGPYKRALPRLYSFVRCVRSDS